MLLCRDTFGRESTGSRYESTPIFGTSLVALSGWLSNWCVNDAHVLLLRYAANIIGGLVFGVGFGLIGYCPGTRAAALGQGNWDAISGIAGLMIGSFLFAEASGDNLVQGITTVPSGDVEVIRKQQQGFGYFKP